MKVRGRVMLSVACALAPALAAGQEPVAKDAGARMQRVAEGVYAILHDDATDAWPHGNTGVVVGDEGVLVVDSCYLPSRAKADIALIRSVTDKPVRYLVFTHWHFDHNNGTVAYRDAFPGLTIVSERETQRFIDVNGTWWPRMSTAPGSSRRADLGKLEEQLKSGKDAEGRALSEEARSKVEKAVGQRKAELDELASLRVVPPNFVFDREITLSLGRRRVQLHDWGRANSPHDVTIYLPDERVLFTGDILVQAPRPYFGSSWPVPWIEVLRQLEAVPIAAMVPGHGPVLHDHGYTRQVRELLEAATSRVEAKVREGLTLEQVQDAVDLQDLRKGVWDSDPASRDEWKVVIKTLVERAWRGVRGQG
jgi:glyoxylase-like metal-dependent hydrolase (beta-lactamase superfamily II)